MSYEIQRITLDLVVNSDGNQQGKSSEVRTGSVGRYMGSRLSYSSPSVLDVLSLRALWSGLREFGGFGQPFVSIGANR